MGSSEEVDTDDDRDRLANYALGFAGFVSGLLPTSYEVVEKPQKRRDSARVIVRNLVGMEVEIDVRVTTL